MITERLLSERFRYIEDRVPSCLTGPQKKARLIFLQELHKKDRYMRVTKCPYCAGDELIKISEVNKRGLPSDIMICSACDGCFKSNVLNNAAAKYYYENISHVLVGKGTTRESMEERFARRLKYFSYPRYRFITTFLRLDPKVDKIVEFGCNDGANLKPWQDNGFTAVGVDLDPQMVNFGKSKELNLIRGDMMECGPESIRPKLIILSHVLSHVTDISAAIKKMREILLPDGHIFIEAPGIKLYGAKDIFNFFDVELNYYFELKSLTRVLERHGLQVLYGDEYMRLLCAPKDSRVSYAAGTIPFSLAKTEACFLKWLARFTLFQDKKLYDLLKEWGGEGFRPSLANMLNRAYFKVFYRAIEKHPRGGYAKI